MVLLHGIEAFKTTLNSALRGLSLSKLLTVCSRGPQNVSVFVFMERTHESQRVLEIMDRQRSTAVVLFYAFRVFAHPSPLNAVSGVSTMVEQWASGPC
jgi:hypothetical protein